MALRRNHQWNAFYAVAACDMMTTCGSFSSAGDAREHFENQLHWETVAPSWWQPKGLANLEAAEMNVEMNVCHRWNWPHGSSGIHVQGLWQQLGSELLVNVAQGCCTSLWKFLQFLQQFAARFTDSNNSKTPHISHQMSSDLQYLRRCDHTLVFLVTSGLEVLAKGCLGHGWQHLPSQGWLLQRRPWLRSLTFARGTMWHFIRLVTRLSITFLVMRNSPVQPFLDSFSRYHSPCIGILEPCHHLVQLVVALKRPTPQVPMLASAMPSSPHVRPLRQSLHWVPQGLVSDCARASWYRPGMVNEIKKSSVRSGL